MFDFFDREFWGIVGVTMQVTITSTIISTVLGVPLGFLLEKANFKGKWFIININRTLMASPPVVVGLLVYILLMRRGVLGFLGLLFTVEAMIIAQVLLITPIVCGTVYTTAKDRGPHIRSFAHTMHASKIQTFWLLIKELKHGIYFAVIAGFGRATSEVGAIMIVGGNIRHNTRTMTTAIAMLRNQGDFEMAIRFGVFLMAIAFSLQIIASLLAKKDRDSNDNI